MLRLALGVLLWSVIHLFPGVKSDFKKNMLNKYGEYPYKGAFTLLMIVAIYLIITGWQSTSPVAPDVLPDLYAVPEWGGLASVVLVLIGFILFLAPYPPNNVRRMMRHPQLIGMVAWGLGHLLAVGTERAILLFGGLAVWSVIEIVVLNRRDGDWIRPDKAPLKKDLTLVLFSVLVYMAFLYSHHLLFGGTPLTGSE
jgi:uncharacterized membrane protein